MSTTPRRLVAPERREEDLAETSLRPQRLSEFIGQQQARANLTVFIEAARARNEALESCAVASLESAIFAVLILDSRFRTFI